MKLPAARASKQDMLRLDKSICPDPLDPAVGDTYGSDRPYIVVTERLPTDDDVTIAVNGHLRQAHLAELPFILASVAARPMGRMVGAPAVDINTMRVAVMRYCGCSLSDVATWPYAQLEQYAQMAGLLDSAKPVERPADFDLHAAIRAFGPALRKLREAHGIRLGELARALGCSGSDLSSIELGEAPASAKYPPSSPHIPLPDRDEAQTMEGQGLFGKYEVKRRDGKQDDAWAEYFVLKVRPMTPESAEFSALVAYADRVAVTHPQLAADLRDRYINGKEAPRGSTADWHRQDASHPVDITNRVNESTKDAALALVGELTSACIVAADVIDDVADDCRSARDLGTAKRRVATLDLAIDEAQGCCDAAVDLDSNDARGEAVARAAGILLDALKAPDQPQDPLRVRIAALEAEVAQLREALAEKRQKLRDQTPVTFLGKQYMVHSEVLFDEAAARVLRPGRVVIFDHADLCQTIARMLDTHQAVQGRAIELEKAVAQASAHLTDAFEEDSRARGDDYMGLAADILRRAL